MKNRKRIPIWVLLSAVISLTTWIIALMIGNRLSSTYQGVSVRLSSAAISQSVIKKVSSEEGPDTLGFRSAWERDPEKKAATSELNATALVHKIKVYGDVLAIESMELLRGALLLSDDKNGCLVDAETAWQLLRTTDAVGAKITLDGKEYQIRGIVQSFDQIMIVRDYEAKYNNIEFATDNFSTAKQDVSTFMLKSGSGEEYQLIENGLLAKLIFSFVWSTAELLMIIAAILSIRHAFRTGFQRKANFISLTGGVLLLAASVVLICNTFYWPQTFLPSKWSDFEFYGKLIVHWSEQIDSIALITPLPKEIEFFRSVRITFFLSIITIVAGLPAMFGYKELRPVNE